MPCFLRYLPRAVSEQRSHYKRVFELSNEIFENIKLNEQKNIFQTYKRLPVIITRGKGVNVWDIDNKKYIDFLSGISVCNLGHCPDFITRAICEQAKRLVHVSNIYYTENQIILSQQLVSSSFADAIFFCNSGTEAIEGVIKTARRYSYEYYGKDRSRIIVMENAFHGRTLGALSATSQPKFHKGFGPMMEGFDVVPYDNPEAIEKAIGSATCGVLLEPVQGEGGVCIPDAGYLKKVRAICSKHNLLMILDEIQTGMGRTGRLWAYEHSGIEPDIITSAKAIANGLPCGAILATDKVAKVMEPGTHGSTFGGSPLVCAAAIEVMNALLNNSVLENCNKMGAYFLSRLKLLGEKYSFIKDVRGIGLMIGMELDRPCQDVVLKCLDKGFLINCTQESVLRFLPPLIIQKQEIDQLYAVLDEIFEKW